MNAGLERTWTVSAKSKKPVLADELTDLAGLWSPGIDVTITKPYTYSVGPVSRRAALGKVMVADRPEPPRSSP